METTHHILIIMKDDKYQVTGCLELIDVAIAALIAHKATMHPSAENHEN